MNLLIGAADKYNSKQLVPWAKTFRGHNTVDDIVLICYRVDADIVDVLKPYNVTLIQAESDDEGREIDYNVGPAQTPVHALRFFHIYQYLLTSKNKYVSVLTTDTRDVIFQNNPFDNNVFNDWSAYILSSEDIRYKDEVWGTHNIIAGFGKSIWPLAKEWEIYNVGVIAGDSRHVRDLCYTIFTMTKNRFIPSDQSAFNVLIHTLRMEGSSEACNHNNNWCAQVGTTLDPSKSHYKEHLLSEPPEIKDGLVYSSKNELFHIVHQWDRHPELQRKYNAYVI